jgi:hypothetical protein
MMPLGGVFGVAGTDHRVRVDQAMLGIAGEIRGLTHQAVQFVGSGRRNKSISVNLEAMEHEVTLGGAIADPAAASKPAVEISLTITPPLMVAFLPPLSPGQKRDKIKP